MTHTQNKDEIEEFPPDWLVTGGQGDFSQMRDGYMLEMKPNRMWRPFLGGKMLDELSEIVPATDGHYPERWICSTTAASDGTGISITQDGRRLTEYVEKPLPVLVKLLDSSSRLMIQVHPDDRRAAEYFHSLKGKAECWHILGTRKMNGEEPYVYLGFKEGITKEKWRDLFEKQDVRGMEESLHKILVHPGDTFFIPGGVPHAMGSGVYFAEVQQPTDITLRTERISPAGETMSDEALHGGAGWDALFHCFDYNGCSLGETLEKYQILSKGELVIQNKYFTMEKIYCAADRIITTDGWKIAIVLDGPEKGKEYFLTGDSQFKAGQTVLLCSQGRE